MLQARSFFWSLSGSFFFVSESLGNNPLGEIGKGRGKSVDHAFEVPYLDGERER
jgi:hypothetical protein